MLNSIPTFRRMQLYIVLAMRERNLTIAKDVYCVFQIEDNIPESSLVVEKKN